MRTAGGAGRRLANRDWLPSSDRYHPDIEAGAEAAAAEQGPEDHVRERRPLDRTGVTVAPETLQPVPGIETRSPAHEVWYLLRKFGAWSSDQWTGQHGVIGRFTDAGQEPGGMQPWDGQRRTLRAQPLVPWDAGTAIGPPGATVTVGAGS